jgi:hypothetical protein
MDYAGSVYQVNLVDTFDCRVLRQLGLDVIDLRRIQDAAGVECDRPGRLNWIAAPLSHATYASLRVRISIPL